MSSTTEATRKREAAQQYLDGLEQATQIDKGTVNFDAKYRKIIEKLRSDNVAKTIDNLRKNNRTKSSNAYADTELERIHAQQKLDDQNKDVAFSQATRRAALTPYQIAKANFSSARSVYIGTLSHAMNQTIKATTKSAMAVGVTFLFFAAGGPVGLGIAIGLPAIVPAVAAMLAAGVYIGRKIRPVLQAFAENGKARANYLQTRSVRDQHRDTFRKANAQYKDVANERKKRVLQLKEIIRDKKNILREAAKATKHLRKQERLEAKSVKQRFKAIEKDTRRAHKAYDNDLRKARQAVRKAVASEKLNQTLDSVKAATKQYKDGLKAKTTAITQRIISRTVRRAWRIPSPTRRHVPSNPPRSDAHGSASRSSSSQQDPQRARTTTRPKRRYGHRPTTGSSHTPKRQRRQGPELGL